MIIMVGDFNANLKKYYLQIPIKLADPNFKAKTYKCIFVKFLIGKKVHFISGMFHQERFIKGFNKMLKLPVLFLSSKCLLINNNAEIPTDSHLLRDKPFFNVTFTDDGIVRIMDELNPNKAHGLDMINICMMKRLENSICRPPDCIFQACLH